MAPVTGFEWPCDRRVAHGPHPIDRTTYQRTRWGVTWVGTLQALDFVEEKSKPELNYLSAKHFQVHITPGATYDADALFNRVVGQASDPHTCPGVKAHPNTMIGRSPTRREAV